jgi:GT2 family glycosyltransferase
MIAVRVFDVADGTPEFASEAASRWHVLALADGSPVARFEMPALEGEPSPALLEAALTRRTDPEIARRALIRSLRERLGPPVEPASVEHRTCSVVVCTHRRPQYVPALLAALAQLDPAPDEIVVVDNDPGDLDCRAQVEAMGARYVREDRRGLDNARNAGLRESQNEIVVFTDDDCVPSKHWLRPLDAAFAIAGVVAITGPAFPYLLDTPARVRMEEKASLARGLRRVAFDWSTINPCHAGAVGVGANMAFRRDVLAGFGEEVFPPELDAGTVTESGGDSFVIARLLAHGYRVLYEPDMFVFHQHRPDGAALHRAVLGYGIGVSAALTKLLVEDHEFSAVVAWTWLIKQYARTQVKRTMGRADDVSTRLAWDYLRGGFMGTVRWRKSLADQRGLGASQRVLSLAPRAPVEEPQRVQPAAATAGADPALSVIIPTIGTRPRALMRCLDSIARQAVGVPFEVIVIDDAREPSLTQSDLSTTLTVRILAGRGGGAAAARNAGAAVARAPILLFLDDDMVAEPELVAAHLARHRSQAARVVVGRYPPRPVERTLIAVAVARWWTDVFGAMEQAIAHGFTSALTGNLSVSTETFARVGGFNEAVGRYRREDWEWGIRILQAGVPIEFEPAAIAHHGYALRSAARVAAARSEGHGDWLLTQRFPGAAAALPIAEHRAPAWSNPFRSAGLLLAPRAPARWLIETLLDALESMRMRTTWSKLFRRIQAASYAQGLRDAGWSQATTPSVSAVELALDGIDEIKAPDIVPPVLRLTIGDEEVGRVTPVDGMWTPALADQIADAVPWRKLGTLAAAQGWIPCRVTPVGALDDVEVVVGSDQRPVAEPLMQAGVRVTIVDPAPGIGERMAMAGERIGPRLVALPIAGIIPDRRWLDEALVAFESDQVGIAWGGALNEREPLGAVYLRGAHSVLDPPPSSAPAPCFVIVRRDLAGRIADQLTEISDPVAAVLRSVAACIDLGVLAARRDTHGLGGIIPDRSAAAAAWAQLLVAELTARPHGRSRRLLARRAAATLLWELIKALRGDADARRLLAATARVVTHPLSGRELAGP